MAVSSPRLGRLALVVLLATTVTLAEDKCRTGCQGTKPQHFKYAEGTTYKYTLESIADISLSSAEGQQSTTKIKANVLLTQQGQCNQVIRLQNVLVSGADGKKHGAIPDIDKPITINFHDGHVEDIICAEKGDTQTSLNIKRAVASLFQAALEHNHETDVFGVCPTEIQTLKDGNILTITKSRILNHCSHRENVKNDFFATAFNLHSEIKSSPILKSDYTAEQRVKDGILDHVLVTENYLYLPFSVGNNGGKATVQTKLHFIGKSKDAGTNKCSVPKSILFENPHPTVSQKSDVSGILAAVKEVAGTIKETVEGSTAAKFNNLIKVLSHAKKDDLLSVYNQIRAGAGFSDKTVGKKVFLDALFRAGTGDNVEVAIELLKNKELGPVEQKLVYLGLAFVKHATPESLTAVTGLLRLPNLPREAYLGIGALAARYCKQHDCKNVPQLIQLSQSLVGKLGDGKATNRHQENEIIAVLKALANMKHLDDVAVPKIVAIAQDKRIPTRLRVAALETYAADACKDKLRDSAIGILKDIQQDSEIRIKAYLALAQCPNGKVANAIKNVLDNEPSYQVGGFIVSHIRNLRSSANPDKELAKSQLANINTMKKFPIDPRKYSHNFEFSYAFDTVGTSSSIENNLIYSQNSYLPRSTSLNLTAEVFGHKLNFLEIDARQENLDRLVEHYLGPLGLLRNKDTEDLYKSGRTSLNKAVEHFKQRVQKTRTKRHVPKAEIENIGKAVQIKTNELNADLDLDLSVKLFGSELLFLSLNEDAKSLTPETIIDKIFDNIDAGIDKVKNFDHIFRSNVAFLDTELVYPTSAGLSLRLALEGTSAVQVKTAGNIDLKALWSHSDTIFKLTVIPSVNVEVSGKMTIDGLVIENGIRMISNLHSATGGALEIDFFNNGQGLDAKFKLPLQKQDLVTAKHEFVFTTRENSGSEVRTPLKFLQSKDMEICLDQLSDFIGLTACVELNSPNTQINTAGAGLSWVLAGNTKFALSIQKDFDVVYHFRDVAYAAEKFGLEVVLEALDEKGEKKFSLQVDAFGRPSKFVKITLDSPIKKAEIEASITDTDKEKSISARLAHDTLEYSAKLGVAVSGSPSKSIYTPLIEYKTPQDGVQKSPYTVEGSIIVESNDGGNKKYIFKDVKLISPTTKPITISGNIGKESNSYFGDVTVTDGSNSGSIKGKVEHIKNGLKINGEVKNTLSPISNFKIDYEVKVAKNHFDSDLELVHGNDFSSKQNTIKLKNYYSHEHHGTPEFKFETKNKFSYPLVGIEAKLELESSKKTLKYDIEGKYNTIKVESELDLKYNDKVRGDYDLEWEFAGIDNKVKIEAKREINGDKSKIEHSIEVNGKKTELEGTITHKVRTHDVEIGAHLVYKCPKIGEPLTIDGSLSLQPEIINTHLKVSTASQIFVDTVLKASKSAGANGHLKVNIKDVLTVSGEIKGDKWKGKAFLLVDLAKLKRKLKTESTFTISAPTYNVALVFYPNFEKDNKKITLTTENQAKENSLTSKHTLDIFGHKFETNVNGHKEGNPALDGKINGEVDLTLPNEMYFVGKFNREIHIISGILNGNAYINVEQRINKNTPGRKFSLKAVGKDVDSNEKTFDITYNLALEDSNGKNLNGDLIIVRKKDGAGKKNELKGKLYGSILPVNLEINSDSTYQEKNGNYHLTTKAGDVVSIEITGDYDVQGNGKPLTEHIKVDVSTNNPKIKKIQFESQGKLLKTDHSVENSLNAKLFVDDDGTTPDATIDFAGEYDLVLNHNNGQLKGKVQLPKIEPIVGAVGYSHKSDNGAETYQTELSLHYGKGKDIKGDLAVAVLNKNEANLDIKLETPYENAKNTKIHKYIKRSDDGKNVNSDLTIDIDGKKYQLVYDLAVSEISPGLKVELTHPNGKTDKLLVKTNRVLHKHFGAEVSAVYHAKDFTFDGSIDANVENIEDFHITIKADSPALKLDKIVFEAKNEKQKGAKNIGVSATSAGNNLIKGSATYKAREEGSKYIVEGSGDFNLKDQKKSLNFKLSKQNLISDKDGEQGVDIRFDAGLGNKAIDAEFKLTNKQFRVLNSYCEEKKQCAHVEIDSKTNKIDLNEYSHDLEINIDLRKLGLSHEFGLKANTKRSKLILDHTVDVHFHNQENKYQYSVYLHPKEAGVVLTTPKRILSLEGNIHVPPKGKGQIKGDISLYLNKKTEPQKKTSLSGTIEYTGDEKKGGVKTEGKFSSPGLGKDLIVNFEGKYDVPARSHEHNLILDIFNKPANKIIVSNKQRITIDEKSGQYQGEQHASIKSVGLEIDITYDETSFKVDTKAHTFKNSRKVLLNLAGHKCECSTNLDIGPSKFQYNLKVHNKDIININSNYLLSKESQVVDTDIQVIGFKPAASHFELKNLNTLKYTLNYKNTPNQKLVVNAGFIPGQIADFRAEVAGKELVHFSLKLDEANFLKPDYALSVDNLKNGLLEPGRRDITNAIKESKTYINNVGTEMGHRVQNIGELAKKNFPNLKQAGEYYTGEAQKIREEINADKTIQEISELLKNIFGAVAKFASEILGKFAEINEKLGANIQANWEKIQHLLENDVLPKLKELGNKLADEIGKSLQQFSDVAFTILGKISEFLEVHQPELKQIATSLSAISQDFGRLIYLNYEKARAVVIENLKKVYEEIKALPIYEEFRSRYELLLKDFGGVTEPLINIIKDALNTVKDITPNEDVKKLIDLISNYLEAKLRHEKVNDIEAIGNIVRTLGVTIKKIFNNINFKEVHWLQPEAFQVKHLSALPRLVAARFSPLAYLADGLPVESIKNSLFGVSFNPRSWIPPFRLYAFVVQGQHIFTFDGKHVTFPGKCNYLLARDAVNGNFTIAGTYTNGILTALTVSDKTDSVTIKKGGQCLLNKDASDFPIRKGQLEAFRLYDSVNIISKAGVKVRCDSQLITCAFSISGFYHGQLRGLLGNGNNEPFDDFTMANGKIVTSESDFANSYKMTASCTPIKVVDHSSHHHAPSCTELFGSASSLRLCFPFVNPENFRTACDHGVAAGVKDTEQAIAEGYVAACNSKFIPIRIPEKFLKCKNSEHPVSIGEKFTVTTPGKAADIVIVVDQAKKNDVVYKDLVQPLVAELSKDLAAKGINDVEYHLLGYGGEYQKYPSHFTNGGKLSWKGKLPNIKFTDAPAEADTDVSKVLNPLVSNIKKVAHELELALGLNLQSRAYVEAITYPFRAHATKSMIVFTAEPCEQGQLLLLQKLRGALLSPEIHIDLVTPLRNFKVKDAKTTKSVIGFSEDAIFTSGEGKKKSNHELHKEIEYDDFCVDWIIKNNGLAFSTDNFLQSKGPARKQYIQTVATNIVEQINSVEQTLECECTYDTPFTVRNKCSVTNEKEKKH